MACQPFRERLNQKLKIKMTDKNAKFTLTLTLSRQGRGEPLGFRSEVYTCKGEPRGAKPLLGNNSSLSP